jgi:1-acyl-sn-glycerol-3-phosphate acyltransferase
MSNLRAVLRSFKLLGYFVRFGGELLLRRPPTREARANWLHRFCASALRGFGVAISVEGTFPARGALITNDIIVLSAIQPCVFVSKAEIRKWPVIGWLAVMSGTVFVERGRGGSAQRAKAGLQAASDAGIPVVFFPEGTTTNGRTLLPFHSGLLAQVLDAHQPITAGFLHYTLDDHNPPTVSVENEVAYWGDINLLVHIFRFLKLRGPHAHVRLAASPIPFPAGPQHRKQAALQARAAVLALAPVPLESTTREPAVSLA